MLKKHAPMLQLDLDEASRVTNEDLGHGLLQVWMPEGQWGDNREFDAKCIRIIPRQVVRATKHLLDIPENRAVTDLLQKISEQDPEERSQEEQEYGLSKYESQLWDEKINGNWWDIRHEVGRDVLIEAKQITGWKAAGYLLPSNVSEDDFWGDGLPQKVYDDPILKAMSEVCNVNHKPSSWWRGCLFGKSYYVYEYLGWRPLFAFDGPMRDPCVDDHTVFFRQTAGGFEYRYGWSRST